MRRLLSLVVFLIVGECLSAQPYLTGVVRDSLTGEAVAFATVYVDGTSQGDVTGEDGSFRIPVSSAQRPLSVVVSHLNYATLNFPVENLNRSYKILLSAKAAALTQIDIEDEDRRGANLREFHRSLIGDDEWGRNARILNERALFFDRDVRRQQVNVYGKNFRPILRRRNLRKVEWALDSSAITYDKDLNLKATTNNTLRIALPDLGYVVRLDLQSFRSDYQSGHTTYLGSTFFQPQEPKNSRQARLQETNRALAYWGSRKHFAQSFLRGTLAENGFQLVEVLPAEGGRAPAKTRPVDLSSYLRDNRDGSFTLAGLEERRFALLYYGGKDGAPLPAKKRKRAQPAQSRFFLLGPTRIYPDGTFGDTNLVFSGAVAQRGLAWWLPADYQPPAE